MDIRNIAVALDIDDVDENLVALAADLAIRHHASLIGVAAAALPIIAVGMEGSEIAGVIYTEQRERTEAAFASAKQRFEQLLPQGISRSWQQTLEPLHAALIHAAHRADLILVGATAHDGPSGGSLDAGATLLGAGRPVLFAAEGQSRLHAERVVIAWKDTKEARRAVADALPLLKLARSVTVVVVDEGDLAVEKSSLQDVLAWLKSHQVQAHGDVFPNRAGPTRAILDAAATSDADLIVSGAYGHSRLREWLLGGVTKDLLAADHISRFFSN